MATIYYQLGSNTILHKRLDEATDWYRKSLTINEELGNQQVLAETYTTLALLAAARQQPRQALEWTIRWVTLFKDFPGSLTEPAAPPLGRLAHQLGMPVLQEAWRELTGEAVPQAAIDYITNYDDNES